MRRASSGIAHTACVAEQEGEEELVENGAARGERRRRWSCFAAAAAALGLEVKPSPASSGHSSSASTHSAPSLAEMVAVVVPVTHSSLPSPVVRIVEESSKGLEQHKDGLGARKLSGQVQITSLRTRHLGGRGISCLERKRNLKEEECCAEEHTCFASLCLASLWSSTQSLPRIFFAQSIGRYRSNSSSRRRRSPREPYAGVGEKKHISFVRLK